MKNTDPHEGRTGLDRIRHATGHAPRDLRDACRAESAFRQELWRAVILLPAARWLAAPWHHFGA
jgi:diacylglycerol kinase (ATP)